MIAGVWGNSNYDSQKEGDEGARRQILERIDEQFADAITEVYTGVKVKSEDEIDWDNPFFAAVKSPRINTEAAIRREPGSLMEEPEDPDRKRLMGELDQL